MKKRLSSLILMFVLILAVCAQVSADMPDENSFEFDFAAFFTDNASMEFPVWENGQIHSFAILSIPPARTGTLSITLSSDGTEAGQIDYVLVWLDEITDFDSLVVQEDLTLDLGGNSLTEFTSSGVSFLALVMVSLDPEDLDYSDYSTKVRLNFKRQ
jgi:hypothetical protein